MFVDVAGLDASAVIAAGAAELERQRIAIETDLAAAVPCAIPGAGGQNLRALAVVTKSPQYRSELGNQLAAKSAEAGLDAVGAFKLSVKSPASAPCVCEMLPVHI